jgi:hypothetical protein
MKEQLLRRLYPFLLRHLKHHRSALSPASPVRRGRKHNWYAIKRSIHGRQLIVREWEDCEPNVKVRPIGGGDKIIPAGVWFKGFDTLDEAVAFLKA